MIPERRKINEVSSTTTPDDSLKVVFRKQSREKESKIDPIIYFSRRGDRVQCVGEVRTAVICRTKYEKGWNWFRYMQKSPFYFLVVYPSAYAGKELLESESWNNAKCYIRLGLANAPTRKSRKT